MKISLDWLQDFINLTVRDPQEIARRVTAGVAEVDDVEVQGRFLENCCVGKILTLEKHPGADRLSVAEIQTDRGKKRVVCGGTNLRQGMRVAFAHVGATVKHGEETMTLSAAKIRGVPSEGMICAAEELELTSKFPPKKSEGERPIVDLGNGDEGVGTSLKDYLGAGDVVLHIDNHAITHRADLFSHVGFAREFVALGLGTWKKQKEREIDFPSARLPFTLLCDDKKAVPYYTAALLEIGGLGETPLWMKRRLEATGWRSISLPIDITNYVMMETGMPHHGFDSDDFQGDLHIRRAKKGEHITTLDGQDRALPEGAIVISDNAGIFDLFGIMGGMRTSTKYSTRHIFLQAGIPDPMSIRRTVIEMGHRTDAATVYEKGVPRVTAMLGLTRAIELFLELVPGARIVSQLEEWGDEGKPKPITLPLEQVSSVLGADVPATTMKKILADLEFTVKATGKSWTVTPPLHRLGDIHGPYDLIEEIGRVYGYDAVTETMPLADTTPPPRDPRLHGIRDALEASTYTELVPLSLLGAALLKKSGMDPAGAVEINNPLGEELKLLQPSVLPGLLEHAERSVPQLLEQLHDRVPGRLRDALFHPDAHLRTFTFGHIFSQNAPEHTELGLLVAAMREPEPSIELLDTPLLLLKEELAAALREAGFALEIAAAGAPPPYAHPGRYAEVFVRPLPQAGAEAHPSFPPLRIGTIFEVHPSVASSFALRHRAAAALLDLDVVLSIPALPRTIRRVPAFPAISYDVTMTLRQTEQIGDMLRRFRGSHPLLEGVETKDLYTGASVGKGLYNVTLRFTYRAVDRTLNEQEAKEAHAKVTEGL